MKKRNGNHGEKTPAWKKARKNTGSGTYSLLKRSEDVAILRNME